MRKINDLAVNTAILTIVTLLIRGVGVVFQMYLGVRLGAAEVGKLSLITAVYRFAVTVGCGGVQLAAAKLAAEEHVKGCGRDGFSLRYCMRYGLCCGAIGGILLYVFSDFIAGKIMHVNGAAQPLRILAVSVPFCALSAAQNGYFSAKGTMLKPSVAQIVSQISFVTVTWIFLKFCICTPICAVTVGMSVSELVLFVLFFFLQPKHGGASCASLQRKSLVKRLLWYALPLALSGAVRSGLTSLEHTLIPQMLTQYFRNPTQAFADYGEIHAMVMPLLLFPSAVTASAATLLIPRFTAYHTVGNKPYIAKNTELVLLYTTGFSVGIAGLFWFFGKEMGQLFFSSETCGNYIRMLAPLVVVMYTDTVVDAILKGLNMQIYSMGVNIFDALLCILLVLIIIPRCGAVGYLYVIIISESVNAILSILRLMHHISFRPMPVVTLMIPTLFIFLSCIVGRFCFKNDIVSFISAVILYVACMILYLPKKSAVI